MVSCLSYEKRGRIIMRVGSGELDLFSRSGDTL